jgi:hypothetical protein
LSTKKHVCLTCFPLGEESANFATAEKSESRVLIHLTSRYGRCVPDPSSWNQKAISWPATEPSSPQSKHSTPPWISGSCSPQTTGQQSSTSNAIASGLPNTGLCGPSVSEFQKSGLKASDVQVGGDHYRKYTIQPAEFCIANGIGFLPGNVIKYVTRYRDKNGAEDIRKAIHYLNLILELEYGEQ